VSPGEASCQVQGSDALARRRRVGQFLIDEYDVEGTSGGENRSFWIG
jgi:hypothetical protein